MARSDGLERIPDGVATPETRRIYRCHFWGRGFNARQSGNAKAETRRLRPAARRDIRDALDRDALDEAPAAYLDWGARIIGEPLR